jgi:hypothetical protein
MINVGNSGNFGNQNRFPALSGDAGDHARSTVFSIKWVIVDG